MPMPPKPKRLTIGPFNAPIVSPSGDVVAARRRTWAGWIDDCAIVQDQFVEMMLTNLLAERD